MGRLLKKLAKKETIIPLIFFDLVIIYFLKDFIFKDYWISFDFKQNDFVKIGILLAIAFIVNIIIILFSQKDISPVKKFLIIAIFIGTFYIFISPLGKGIDENSHFSRVYSFFLDSKTTDSGEYKAPRLIKELDDNNKNLNFSYIRKKIVNNDLVTADNMKGARLYTPLSYIPFLLPVWILGFLIKTNIFSIFISARFFGFLLYLIISAYSIKIVPKRKDFFSLFCLMPIVITSGTTVTADLLTNSSIILFIAIWYKLYLEKTKITKKDIILIIICGILAGYSKMVYALEFLLIFFLPKEVFGGTNKKKFKTVGIIAGVIIIATILNVAFAANSMNNSYEKFKLQKEFILKNPLKFLLILGKNILDNYKFFFSFTTNFVILHNIFIPSEYLQLLYFVALLMVIYKEESNLNLGKLKTFFIILIGLSIIAIIYISLYLQYTTEISKIVGGNVIIGLQSRYYIPVILMFLVCLPSKKDTLKINDNIPYYISLFVNVVILIGVMMKVI